MRFHRAIIPLRGVDRSAGRRSKGAKPRFLLEHVSNIVAHRHAYINERYIMNIEDLTIGQARELAGLFCKADSTSTHPFAGEYCVFRGYRCGVYCGKLTRVVAVGRESYFEVEDSRRMQYQKYVGFTLCSVATQGIDGESKLSPPVPIHHLAVTDIEEIFPCSEHAERLMRGQKNG